MNIIFNGSLSNLKYELKCVRSEHRRRNRRKEKLNQLTLNWFQPSVRAKINLFPGTPAPVERIFAHVEKLWQVESSALAVETLKSMLLVKCNMEFSCLNFYDFLKTQPELLRKIAGQDKYSFKEPRSSEMSVDLDSSNVSL